MCVIALDKINYTITQVTSNGVATKTGKLKTGDRILKVNSTMIYILIHAFTHTVHPYTHIYMYIVCL